MRFLYKHYLRGQGGVRRAIPVVVDGYIFNLLRGIQCNVE